MHESVLIVEDDPGVGAALRVRLSAAGFKARWIDDGARGLASAIAQTPDAIILDLGMPGLNGFEVCRQARATPVLRHTPIVVVSANAAEDARARSIDAGADDFVGKPYDAPALIRRIRDLIRDRAHGTSQET